MTTILVAALLLGASAIGLAVAFVFAATLDWITR